MMFSQMHSIRYFVNISDISLLRNSIFVVFFGVLLSFSTIPLPQSFSYTPEETTWQLVVISSEPACSGYHHYMVEKYYEITTAYLDLYKLFHGSYEPKCFTEDDFIEQYNKPLDLDLLILVFDKDKGMADLHTHNTGGVYIHQGNDLSTNHNIIICDCPNFKYSDSVWILSHELSHFVLNYLGFDLDKVENEIHGIDYKFDRCVEVEYESLCSTIKTRIETNRAYWTVMIPYEEAVGLEPPPPLVEKVSLESPYQTAMIKEITNWWNEGEISDKNYISSLKILSGKVNEKNLNPDGVFKNSAILMLTDSRTDNQNKTIAKEDFDNISKNFLKINLSISKNQTEFSETEKNTFLDWLKIKTNSWKENKINDDEFILDLERVLDSPNPSLFLKSLENKSFDELIAKAEQYQQVGEYRNALSFYDQALLKSDDSDDMKITALIGKGSALISIGEYDNALEHYDLALEIKPENIELLKKMAFVLAQLGLVDEARGYFEVVQLIKSE